MRLQSFWRNKLLFITQKTREGKSLPCCCLVCFLFLTFVFYHQAAERDKFNCRKDGADKKTCHHADATRFDTSDNAEKANEGECAYADLNDLYNCLAGEKCHDAADEFDKAV